VGVFFVPPVVSGGVVLLAVGAMELVYLCFGCCFFFCFEQIRFVLSHLWECLSFVFFRFSFELDLHSFAGDLTTRPPLCCSPSTSVPAVSSSDCVVPPCLERGLHAPKGLPRMGRVPFSGRLDCASGKVC
jgi:hypothetical protein